MRPADSTLEAPLAGVDDWAAAPEALCETRLAAEEAMLSTRERVGVS